MSTGPTLQSMVDLDSRVAVEAATRANLGPIPPRRKQHAKLSILLVPRGIAIGADNIPQKGAGNFTVNLNQFPDLPITISGTRQHCFRWSL